MSGGWLSFENLIILIELEIHIANQIVNVFVLGITSEHKVKFMPGFCTTPKKLVLLVDLAMLLGYFPLRVSMKNNYMEGPGFATIKYRIPS